MSTQLTRIVSPRFVLAIAVGLALTACNKSEEPKSASVAATANAATPNPDLAWAKAALERNPELEVLAVDPQSGVVTVKNRSSGETEAIKASELVAVLPSQLKAMRVSESPSPEVDPAPEQSATAPEQTAQSTAPAAGSATATTGQSDSAYTIDRSGGQIRVSGPGVSIVSSGANPSGANAAGAGRRAVDPFICEGRRTLQLDNRNIYVDGDALTVRGGCEVFITNSQIVASGTGIVVQDATVHISNSHIEGANASFQAEDRAKMFVRGSTFQGVSRRAELATVQDQGGNRWR
ncbi:MAG TPA: hypothetical protein VFO35_13215 [Steroidobacteraceae bacterium]|nr:hypothetical protein [Steroidobacteraceae bacterium]